MTPLQQSFHIALVGIGATAVMDAWLLLLQRLGVPTLNFAYIGRWIGHLPRGRIRHAPIARSQPVPGEHVLGWLTHYGVGVAFAALLVWAEGTAWLLRPDLGSAIVMGMLTVVAPLFVMQPAMGAGIASSRTPTPVRNVLRSLANHTVFGLGLYLSAVTLALCLR
jgi:hypothetical protein